jgi:hypothetical protein
LVASYLTNDSGDFASSPDGRRGDATGPKKDRNGFITEPGHMVVYVAGYPAIHGIQPLYFKDPELLRRARIPVDSAQTTEVGIA